MATPKIAICIPTMRRFDYLVKTLPMYLEIPCVDQVVVSDETGEDIAQIRATPIFQTALDNGKLVLHKNPGTHGAFYNKMESVCRARPGWVALIDSDNKVDEARFFQPWLAFVAVNGLDKNVIYMPSGQDGRQLQFDLFDVLDATNIGTAAKLYRLAMAVLNNGNFIANTAVYKRGIPVPQLAKLIRDHPKMALDAAVQAVGMIANGCRLQIVPGMVYDHAVHDQSLYATYMHTPECSLVLQELIGICELIQQTFLASRPTKRPTALPEASEALGLRSQKCKRSNIS